MQLLGTHQQDPVDEARLDHSGYNRRAVDETRTGGVEVECAGVGGTDSVLDHGGHARAEDLGRTGGYHHEVDLLGVQP